MATKICPEYDALTPQERVTMIGKIQHALQTDTATFQSVSMLIGMAEMDGVFEGVKIDADPDQKIETIKKAIRDNELNNP